MKKYLAAVALCIPFFSVNSYADKVLEVYSCGADVGIKMQTGGWVVIRSSEVGEARLNRMYSMALMLLASGKSTGYYNASATVLPEWCGITNQVRSITVLSAVN